MLCGWLAPDGAFYNCDYMCHIDLAEEFCDRLGYPSIINERSQPADEVLVHHGWVKCYYSIFDRGHTRIYGPTRLTEPQKAILREDYFEHPENWDKAERYFLEELEVLEPKYDESGCRV